MSKLDHDTGYYMVYPKANRNWVARVTNLVGCNTYRDGFNTKAEARAYAENRDQAFATEGRLFAD